MRCVVVAAVVSLAGGLCAAQDTGRVLSSTPVIQQVQVPRQICSTETWQPPAQRSGAGAAIGAIAGGALGNAVGQGGGRAAATVLGIIGGAMVGDRIESPNPEQSQNVQRCTTQTVLENRVVAYQVVYEYAGKQYAAQLPQDPGPQVQLQITPMNALPPAAPPSPITFAPAIAPQVVYVQPAYVGSASTWYPSYRPYGYGPPLGINLQFGYGSGHRGHWR